MQDSQEVEPNGKGNIDLTARRSRPNQAVFPRVVPKMKVQFAMTIFCKLLESEGFKPYLKE